MLSKNSQWDSKVNPPFTSLRTGARHCLLPSLVPYASFSLCSYVSLSIQLFRIEWTLSPLASEKFKLQFCILASSIVVSVLHIIIITLNMSVAGTVGARQTYEIVTMQLTCAYNSYTHIISTYVVRICAANYICSNYQQKLYQCS